ncbi:phosphoenolpyruvate--protein phosphotransferase [Subtercola boreus]|uniref:Phosphoenolpyruvate-protein phosphotransferase n=1 Tax=Subtercola boreus TaxID=120213 RepID=A0A3E0W6S6_9MICO|nr:putative PEP-binding protein [Subtercola boreus]RFA18243.1 phosphoenolpyruvate--protein phosphotransferase [Subtercola boreus]RFA18635.1 phosphoenolpyruvate--protein phosphotransferase [Subtercola boreus]RFA25239.1 phosphoenolpyruvate--protein phosphotransferase [Subtercola boreus]
MLLKGVGVGRGVAVGPTLRMPEPLDEPIDEVSVEPVASAFARVEAALAAVAADLEARGELAGGEAQNVLQAQSLMAADPTIVDDIQARLGEGRTADRAVFEAYAGFRDLLVQMGGYMAERATDLDDVSRRVIANLRGVPAPGVPESPTPFILVAHDLAPADTALLDLDRVIGLITREGGPTSHTAILARSKSIPAIVGVQGAENLADGMFVVLDAVAGTVDTEPSDDDVADARARIAERAALAAAPLSPGALADGTPIPLLANLGSADGAAEALALGAEGVGLFRTEFLFLDSTSAPTVEQQVVEYERMLRAFVGKKVVVRVLDAGADKPLAFLNDAHEENPALGLRGIRALKASEQVLLDQLTALAEAEARVNGSAAGAGGAGGATGAAGAAASGDTAHRGRHAGEATETGGPSQPSGASATPGAERVDLWVMAPMIADADDAEYFTSIARELGIRVAGVMAEVPSLAVLADQVFEIADFVSIGTNDLTQYTLAADRLLGSVAHLQDPWHPAVLRLVGMLGRAGREANKPVGVCGEAAADPLLAVVLVGLGITTLSMTPAAIADVRAELALHTLPEAQALARAAVSATSAARARTAVTRLAAANAVG